MKVEKDNHAIDQLMRQTRAHHVQLSAMADMKANMLLTVSMLVITFTAPNVVDPLLRWPAIIVCAFCLATVVLAAYAVMPKITLPGRNLNTPPPDVKSKGFNVLFFGDYTKLTFEQFEDEMEEILNDPGKTYQAMVREVYTMGQFLAHKKYRFIRLAYTAFIIGLVLSGLTLLITLMVNSSELAT